MEELYIFRTFAAFPLFGLLLPDFSSLLVVPHKGIPFTHVYIAFFYCSALLFAPRVFGIAKGSKKMMVQK